MSTNRYPTSVEAKLPANRKAAGLTVFPERTRIVPELERMGVMKFKIP